MDCVPLKERDTVIDIESCIFKSNEVGNTDDKLGTTVPFIPTSVDEIFKGEISVNLSNNPKNVDEFSLESGKKSKREKRKSTSAKKHPKPPRPPRGLSVDAADQKLIKEISELAMIKRARIERMKALKKMKAAKASSVSASSSGNLIAIVFTVIFFIVIIFQGCHSSGISLRNRSVITILGSLESNGVAEGSTSMAQDQRTLSSSGVPITSVESPNLMELVPGSDRG